MSSRGSGFYAHSENILNEIGPQNFFHQDNPYKVFEGEGPCDTATTKQLNGLVRDYCARISLTFKFFSDYSSNFNAQQKSKYNTLIEQLIQLRKNYMLNTFKEPIPDFPSHYLYTLTDYDLSIKDDLYPFIVRFLIIFTNFNKSMFMRFYNVIFQSKGLTGNAKEIQKKICNILSQYNCNLQQIYYKVHDLLEIYDYEFTS